MRNIPPEQRPEDAFHENLRPNVLLRGAQENSTRQAVTLPLRRGRTDDGRTFQFVITDASSPEAAAEYGVNYAPRLALSAGSPAAQEARWLHGELRVRATVDFSAERLVVPGPQGYPPSRVRVGAWGEAEYSPLATLPDGTVINAAHVANDSGLLEQVLDIDSRRGTVTLRLVTVYYGGQPAHALVLDASGELLAALEAASLAPGLQASAGGVCSPLAVFTGIEDDPGAILRAGVSSSLFFGQGALHVGQCPPEAPRPGLEPMYSPLKQVYLTALTGSLAAAGWKALRDFSGIAEFARRGKVRGPEDTPWGPSGVVLNSPVVNLG